MKLICNVEVYNRLSTLGQNIRRKRPQRSCLAIGRQSVKSNEITLLLQTGTSSHGTKYKIDNNIEQIFTKFVNEGKATIRLKEPSHDINIQCDPIQLKSFLHVLKLGLSKKLDPAILNLSNLNPKTIIAAAKTKLVIKEASNYPVLQGFPRTTEELVLSGLQRRSFDRQILRLQSLRVLDLSENQLTSLPQELGSLPNLQELNLSSNQLGKFPVHKWSWLSSSNISRSLRLLNLSNNQLTKLPDEISKLKGLFTLNLNNNLLEFLIQGIGSLNKLKFLICANNKLTYLPGSIKNLRLNELDISGNPFGLKDDQVMSVPSIKVPSLVNIAGQVVLQNNTYYDASVIPFTLVYYLDKANYCVCGAPCLDMYWRTYTTIPLSAIARTFKFTGLNDQVYFDCIFCSYACRRRYYHYQ